MASHGKGKNCQPSCARAGHLKTAEIRANIPNQKSITAVRVAGAASILARARRLTGLRFR